IENENFSGIVGSESNEEAIQYLKEGITDALGAENLMKPIVTSGGDDFHYYTVKYPRLKGAMIGLGCDLQTGLHRPKMIFDCNAFDDDSVFIFITMFI